MAIRMMRSLIALAIVLWWRSYEFRLHLWVHGEWCKCYGSNMSTSSVLQRL